jgi:hypothetical protein
VAIMAQIYFKPKPFRFLSVSTSENVMFLGVAIPSANKTFSFFVSLNNTIHISVLQVPPLSWFQFPVVHIPAQ